MSDTVDNLLLSSEKNKIAGFYICVDTLESFPLCCGIILKISSESRLHECFVNNDLYRVLNLFITTLFYRFILLYFISYYTKSFTLTCKFIILRSITIFCAILPTQRR